MIHTWPWLTNAIWCPSGDGTGLDTSMASEGKASVAVSAAGGEAALTRNALSTAPAGMAMISSTPSDHLCSVSPRSRYTYPCPAASAAAHVPLKGSGFGLVPGVYDDQLVAPVWMSKLEPSGDQLKDSTAGASNSRLGRPASFTIQTPPDVPSFSAVANATQWCSGRTSPVRNVKLRSRSSSLPCASSATVLLLTA